MLARQKAYRGRPEVKARLKEYMREYYANNKVAMVATKGRWAKDNPDKMLGYRMQYYAERRARNLELRDEARAGGCMVCGEMDPVCLDFHHRDPATKEHALSRLWTSTASEERIRDEISKCVILCSNCHRKHHAGKLDLPPEKMSLIAPNAVTEASEGQPGVYAA
jgi:hypothetical protein